jgi:16S rRNA (guanine966-N2)-methyltransferase
VNEVRIISGKWRRRKLAFPDRPTLRPTPDRARETVFNWLAQWLDGARCLDLFAGSGALGFEALSRGAAAATLVDDDPAVIRALQESARAIGATDCTIRRASALDFLRGNERSWDIVFLDPPFDSRLLEQTLEALGDGAHLHDESIVYVESSVHRPPLLGRWRTMKSTRTGDVQSQLVQRGV